MKLSELKLNLENNEDSDFQKQYENEEDPLKLSTMDFINNFSNRRRKNNEKQKNKCLNIMNILLWVLLVLIFFISIIYIFLLFNSPDYVFDLDIQQYQNQSTNNIINKSNTDNNLSPKIINTIIKVNESNKIDLPKNSPKRNLSVGFFYSCIVGTSS